MSKIATIPTTTFKKGHVYHMVNKYEGAQQAFYIGNQWGDHKFVNMNNFRSTLGIMSYFVNGDIWTIYDTGERIPVWSKKTKDGYLFAAYKHEDKIFIRVGCRLFSPKEAEKHWTQETSYWTGNPKKWNRFFGSVEDFNHAAVERQQINQERLNYVADAYNALENK